MKYIDLDFFQPERDRIALKRKKMIPLVLLAIALIFIILFFGYLHHREKKLEKDLYNTTERNLEIQTDIATLEKEIDDIERTLERYEEGASGQDPFGITGGVSINQIRAEHLNSIIASTPKEAFYSKVLIEENLLTLEGYTDSTTVVAKIVYNIEQTGYYNEVLITNIATSEDTGYVFTINAHIKE